MAKNQAAECVIRDMILKQMQELPTADGTNGTEIGMNDFICWSVASMI